jgi:hypothetical protein
MVVYFSPIPLLHEGIYRFSATPRRGVSKISGTARPRFVVVHAPGAWFFSGRGSRNNRVRLFYCRFCSCLTWAVFWTRHETTIIILRYRLMIIAVLALLQFPKNWKSADYCLLLLSQLLTCTFPPAVSGGRCCDCSVIFCTLKRGKQHHCEIVMYLDRAGGKTINSEMSLQCN